jgi:hypothetical protein
MKRYYKIDNYDELLKYIKSNGLVDDSEGEALPLLLSKFNRPIN